MSNFIIKNGVKIQRTPEQIAEIEAWKKMTDADIDYSDIPKISHEEFLRAFARKRAEVQKNNLQIAS